LYRKRIVYAITGHKLACAVCHQPDAPA